MTEFQRGMATSAVIILALALICLFGPMAHCQSLMPIPEQQFFDTNGKPLANGFVYTYQTGTLTPQNSYTDYTGTAVNTNPVQLNGSGFPTCSGLQCGIWLGGGLSYRIVVQNSSHVPQYTIDGINGGGTGGGNVFGGGTIGTFPLWSGSSALSNSILTQSSTEGVAISATAPFLLLNGLEPMGVPAYIDEFQGNLQFLGGGTTSFNMNLASGVLSINGINPIKGITPSGSVSTEIATVGYITAQNYCSGACGSGATGSLGVHAASVNVAPSNANPTFITTFSLSAGQLNAANKSYFIDSGGIITVPTGSTTVTVGSCINDGSTGVTFLGVGSTTNPRNINELGHARSN